MNLKADSLIMILSKKLISFMAFPFNKNIKVDDVSIKLGRFILEVIFKPYSQNEGT